MPEMNSGTGNIFRNGKWIISYTNTTSVHPGPASVAVSSHAHPSSLASSVRGTAAETSSVARSSSRPFLKIPCPPSAHTSDSQRTFIEHLVYLRLISPTAAWRGSTTHLSRKGCSHTHLIYHLLQALRSRDTLRHASKGFDDIL